MRSKQFLRRLLLTEVVGYSVFWSLVTYHFQLSLLWWLPAVVGGWIALRVIVVGLEFLLSAWYAARAPEAGRSRIGPLTLLRCMAVEISHIVPSFSLFQPFPDLLARAALADAAPRQDPTTPVVLLIHGFTCNPAVFRWLRRRLEADGLCVEVVELEPVFGPIAGYVPLVTARIESVCQRHGAERIHVVAHSMGGLVTRATLAHTGDARIASVTTIGSPHQGTELARFSAAPNAADMLPGCDFLADLQPAKLPLACWLSIASDQDNLITPPLSAVLPGTHALRLSGIGHISMIFDAAVRSEVVRGIRLHADLQPQVTRVTEECTPSLRLTATKMWTASGSP
ncbi:alpha/beta fold hydrolase [soil metagenome]